MLLNRQCKITFIAHGATIFSEENRFSHVETYPPLNEAGEDEMEKICLFLKKRSIKNDKIYTSGGTRTMESAEIIAKMYKTDIEIIDELKPRTCGIWNNLTMQYLIKHEQESLEKLITQPDEHICEGAESLTEFVERVGKTINNIIQQNIGNRIIIVTYPDVIQAAIVHALDLPREKMFNFFVKTGSATQISYFEKINSLKYSGYLPMY